MLWLRNGFRGVCRGTKMVIVGDSGEYNDDTKIVKLIGHAKYSEDSVSMTANTMTYHSSAAQILAEGDVKVRMKNGSTLDADLFQYLRPIPQTRPGAQADASGRTRLVMRDSTPQPDSTATVITADRIHMVRDSMFYAGGRVVMVRPDIIGTADSAETNSNRRTARLIGTRPQLKGKGARAFTIEGNLLDITGREKQLERLIAKGKATAVSDSMNLSADTLDISTTGDVINRVEAWGAGRAHAVSPDQDIAANRILIAMPGGKIQDLRAFGRARAEMRADSTIAAKERDWIEGDSLTALFESSAAQGQKPNMRQLLARGNAKSYYQSATQDKSCKAATENYVTGTRIQVEFKTGLVNDVRVNGNVRGTTAKPCPKVAVDSVPPRRRNSQ